MRKSFFALFLSFIGTFSLAQTAVTMNTTGNWNDPTKWGGSDVGNVITDNVTLANSVNPTILGTDNFTVGNVTLNQDNFLTIKSSGQLILGSSSSSKTMTTGLNAKITVESGATLVIWGNFVINNNIVLDVAGSLIVHGNISINGSNSNFNVTGSMKIDGNFTGSGNNDTNISGTGKINVNGSVTIPSGNLNGPAGSFLVHGSCTGTYCSSSTLPIQLISFSATPSHSEMTLNWSTASEQNFDYFILEVSTDGFNFYEIARIHGHGNSTVRHNYQWIDEKAQLGKSYYRLTEVDFDKTVIHLNTISTDFSGKKKLILYPNPVSDGKVTFELNFNPSQNVSVSIHDLRGAVIDEFVLGQQSLTVPLRIASGMYLVVVRGSDFRTSSSLIVK